MDISKAELVDLIHKVVKQSIKEEMRKNAKESANADVVDVSANANIRMSVYKQVEQLLYNYRGFKKIIDERTQEIRDIEQYGVTAIGSTEQVGRKRGGTPQGIVLDEERKASAIRRIQKSMVNANKAVQMVDDALATCERDPYYKILPMMYFEGRTQDDIAVEFNCAQQNIAYHKKRLIKALALQMFPDKVARELTT